MRLDVIIPTYNRCDLLIRTLDSLFTARRPPELAVSITVVDNNSKDRTRPVVEAQMQRFQGRLGYVFESRQGRSHALNAGIRSTDGDLVGMIDDDEEVDPHWYECIYSAFTQMEVDFIGGPYYPRWGAEPPAWLPADKRGVIGWVDGGPCVRPFDESYPGNLMGGNAVLRRSLFEKVGLYATDLGRTDKHLLSCEDEEMYKRLLAAGARGFYLPDLIIYHYIPPERLTRKYFRQWCFWRGVSLGVLDRKQPSPVAYLAGVPRWLYGRAARGLLRIARTSWGRDKDAARNFSDELAFWDLAGFFYGKHFYRPRANGDLQEVTPFTEAGRKCAS
ncbi:MAG TPA: glycosyltransferase [Blastocatellia bacterium]|nr:glycosyltransferase [Blastocatellia bacterium]